MLLHYRFITAGLGIAIAAIIIGLTRHDKLRSGYSLWWILVALALAVLGVFPRIIDVIGHMLGISYPPILAIILAICMLLVKIITMDIERSHQQRVIRTLTQRLAVLESEQLDNDD